MLRLTKHAQQGFGHLQWSNMPLLEVHSWQVVSTAPPGLLVPGCSLPHVSFFANDHPSPHSADPGKFARMMADPLVMAACRKMCIEPEELVARPFEDFRKEVCGCS